MDARAQRAFGLTAQLRHLSIREAIAEAQLQGQALLGRQSAKHGFQALLPALSEGDLVWIRVHL
jgi:hypothetical protein